MPRALAILALALAGCTQSGTGVSLTVDAAGLMPDELDVSASYDGRTVSRVVSVGGAGTLTLLAELPDESLSVTFTVVGKRSGGVVGQGKSGAIAVAAHHIASATVTLRSGGGGDMGTDAGARDLSGGGGTGGTDLGVWTLQHGALPPSGASITGMWGTSGDDVYATSTLGANINLWHTTDHGAHWTGQLVGGAINLNGVHGSDANTVYLVGDGGNIYIGSGTTWNKSTAASINASTKLYGVFVFALNDAWVVGDGNVIAHQVTGGWVLQTSVGSTTYHSVWGVPNQVWVVGSAGTIQHWVNGSGWDNPITPTTAELRAVFGTSATDIWAAGDGVLLHSIDGKHWTDASSSVPSGISLRALSGAGGTILAGGSGWTLLRHDAGGWSLDPTGLTVDSTSGDRFNGVFVPNAGEAFAGGDGLVIVHQ